LALFFFAGLPAGYLVAIPYVVLHRWLPAGRLAGPLLGILLLIWLGALLDPLRADNIDFNIVGPDRLAVALFTGLSILHGAVAVGFGALALLTWLTVFPPGSALTRRTAHIPPSVGAGVLVAASAAVLPAFVSAVISIASRTT
jgi:hypothetical protein